MGLKDTRQAAQFLGFEEINTMLAQSPERFAECVPLLRTRCQSRFAMAFVYAQIDVETFMEKP